MREAQSLKEQVDAKCQKEVGLKPCIQPYLKEAFTVTTTIEGKLAQMQDTYVQRQWGAFDSDASESHTQLLHRIMEEFVVDVIEAQKLLDGL